MCVDHGICGIAHACESLGELIFAGGDKGGNSVCHSGISEDVIFPYSCSDDDIKHFACFIFAEALSFIVVYISGIEDLFRMISKYLEKIGGGFYIRDRSGYLCTVSC